MTSSAELFALQEADLALDNARVALADTKERLGENGELVEAREAVAACRDALRAAERNFKDREWEADELRSKIEPLDRKLYEGSVRNPKELEDLQRDVVSLKRRRSELEDSALEAMEALERAQQALADAERRYQELNASHEREQQELHARKLDLDREIARLEERRAEEASGIDAAALRLYEELRSIRQGRAVAKVVGGACQGCRISLPMNLIQRARSGAGLVQCSSCERILHVS